MVSSKPDADTITLKELFKKLKQLWGFILSKWKPIVIAGFLGCLIGFAIAFLKTPTYKGELSFALQDEKSGSGLGGALGLASQFGLDIGGGGTGGEFSGENLLLLMKSRSMVEKALLTSVVVQGKKQTLVEFYIDSYKLRESWMGKPDLKQVYFAPEADPTKFTIKQDSVLGILYGKIKTTNLSVDKQDKKLSIITVTVISVNQLFSKYYAEVLTKVVSDFYIETKTQKASRNVRILQKQTDSVRRELNASLSGVAYTTDSNPNANPLLSILRVPSQRRTVDVQANTAIFTELVKNLELAKMNLLQATPLIQIIDRPILPLEKNRASRSLTALGFGTLFGFFTIVFFLIRRAYKNIIES